MAFPTTKEFESFLRSLTLRQPHSAVGWAETTLAQEQAVLAENGKVETFPAIRVWYSTSGELGIDAFLRRFASELKIYSHPSSDSVVRCLTGVLAAADPGRFNRLSLLNEMLSGIIDCDVCHYVFLAPTRESAKITWAGFSVGRIDIDKCFYRCKKAGWDKELSVVAPRLRDCSAIESPIYSAKTLSWPALIPTIRTRENAETVLQLYERYFKACSDVDIERMWQNLDESQYLFSAFDCDWIAARRIRRSPIAKCVSIYLCQSSAMHFGQVAFRTGIYTTHFGASDKARFDKAQTLQAAYGFSSFSQSELHQTLKSFLRFVHKGGQHAQEGQTNEAFLHEVIALEILFSEAKATSDTVSSRVAVLVHRKLMQTYPQMSKTMLRLYDLRSKYVHRGVPVSEDNYKQLQNIVLAVLECLLRLQGRPESHGEGFFAAWLKRVDWIGASLEANLIVDAKTFTEHGIE